jgi:copper chaperone CopZ
VQKSLEAVKGVKKASVDLGKKEAAVVYDDQQTNIAALIQAISKTGFTSSVRMSP